MKYIYIQSEITGRDYCTHNLWTVGFYDSSGKFQPESDHKTAEEAAKRINYLNGAN
jgi:hypothetical protein